ncbi:ArsR/SmtB family transcription factor [Granulicella cerasi]|uniref:ArsR/SmtB family transcription factor n=1 Tax=Granulicella cerasi TaxID=741063 RepID=A0ABW1Z8W4_9BACT|nr:helix-turn-helix domain-containing protein [Granulicella cerasi]
MRPLFHPEIADVPVEAILHALADPVRVAILADLSEQTCSQNCSSFAHVLQKPIPKSTLSQHFKILREAGLIRSERRGVEVQNTSRCVEVDALYPGLIGAIVNALNIQSAAVAKAQKRAARKR